jgi:hypothetical protein
MENFDLQNDFIKYWDKVIDFWMDKEVKDTKGERRDAKRPLEKQKESYYKDDNLKVQIEKDQLCWFENDKLNKLLCPIHMPEPYWGNPDSCSIVVVDYNPAGGTDMNPQTYRGNGVYPVNTMIDYVNKESYSKLSKDFPILKAKKELKEDERWWLRSYGGRQWWRRKIEWMLHLIQPNSEPSKEWPKNVNLPFAIELCGWHSPNWPDNTQAIEDNDNLKKSIHKWFVNPLLKSIEESTSKMAVCIGAQFKPSILGKYFDNGNINVTKNIANSLLNETTEVETANYKYRIKIMNDNEASTVLNKDSMETINYSMGVSINKIGKEKETTRYYRVYNVVENGKNHIILNTFAPGSNHHPAKEFWEFENILIKAIRDEYSIK